MGVVMVGRALSSDGVVLGLGFFVLVWIKISCVLPCVLCR